LRRALLRRGRALLTERLLLLHTRGALLASLLLHARCPLFPERWLLLDTRRLSLRLEPLLRRARHLLNTLVAGP
jgi:hypothetical protein